MHPPHLDHPANDPPPTPHTQSRSPSWLGVAEPNSTCSSAWMQSAWVQSTDDQTVWLNTAPRTTLSITTRQAGQLSPNKHARQESQTLDPQDPGPQDPNEYQAGDAQHITNNPIISRLGNQMRVTTHPQPLTSQPLRVKQVQQVQQVQQQALLGSAHLPLP